MAFRIKDLMINLAGRSRASNACAENVAPDQAANNAELCSCTGRHTNVVVGVGEDTDIAICVGIHTDLGGCTGRQTHPIACTGRQTHPVGCTARQTNPVACTGRQTHLIGCTGRHTHLVGCAGQRTEITDCTGKQTHTGGWENDPDGALEDLNAIKAQLLAELAEVDGEIKEIENGLQPKTIEEVEELQTKLQEALDELGKIKSDLEKK